MKFSEFHTYLSNKQPSGAYLFIGTEGYLRDRGVALLRDAFFRGSFSAEQCMVVRGREDSMQEFAQWCRTIGLFGERKFGAVINAGALSKSECSILKDLVNSQMRELCIALSAERLDRNDPVWNSVRSRVQEVSCWNLSEKELAGWIFSSFKRGGIHIEADAVRALIDSAGSDMSALANEMEILRLFYRNTTRITSQDVLAVSGARSSNSVYDFLRHLIKRDASSAMQELLALWYEGEEPVKLLNDIFQRVTKAAYAKTLIEQGNPGPAVVRQLKLHPVWDRDFPGQVRAYSKRHIMQCIAILAQSDRSIKKGYMDAHTALLTAVRRILD